MSYLSIKLEAAKRAMVKDRLLKAIAFPGFHSDDLLEIALTDPCTLNEMNLSKPEQEVPSFTRFRKVIRRNPPTACLVNGCFIGWSTLS